MLSRQAPGTLQQAAQTSPMACCFSTLKGRCERMGKKNAKLRRKAKWTKSRQWNTCTAAQRVMAASAVGRGSKTTYITTSYLVQKQNMYMCIYHVFNNCKHMLDMRHYSWLHLQGGQHQLQSAFFFNKCQMHVLLSGGSKLFSELPTLAYVYAW